MSTKAFVQPTSLYSSDRHITQWWRRWHIEAGTKWTPFRRRHFPVHFLEWNVWIPVKISLKIVPKDPINNIPALVQKMASQAPKLMSEPMVVNLLMHVCLTRPQWVNMSIWHGTNFSYGYVICAIYTVLVAIYVQCVQVTYLSVNQGGVGLWRSSCQ